MSYGNTIKKKRDIAYFYEKGVRLYATDSLEDVVNIAEAAPGAKVFFRLYTEGTGSDWPLSRKFGAHPDQLERLRADVDMVASHPLVKGYAEVGGFMYDVDTGRLQQLI